MRIKVLFFASAREAASTREITVACEEGATVSDLLHQLLQKFPNLEKIRSQLRFSMNEEFVSLEAELVADAEVALIPPISGGNSNARLLTTPLKIEDVEARVEAHGLGGRVTFTGIVRNSSHGKNVTKLEYEAYEKMALRKLEEVIENCAQSFPSVRIAVDHRLGTLVPGEIAVIASVASAHRKEAFEACSLVIELLKQNVPIFKKEFFEDESFWVGQGP